MERLDVVRVGNNCRAFRPPGSPPLSGPHPYLPNKNSRGSVAPCAAYVGAWP